MNLELTQVTVFKEIVLALLLFLSRRLPSTYDQSRGIFFLRAIFQHFDMICHFFNVMEVI